MKYFSFWLLCFFLTFCYGCKNKQKDQESSAVVKNLKREFHFPSIPTVLTTPNERADYLATHYWEKFDFNDTSYIHLNVTEQAMVNFIDVIKRVSANIADSAMTRTMKEASVQPKMFKHFWNTFNKYLNDPNSPLRNEDLYIITCRSISQLTNIDEAIVDKAEFKLKMALKNRKGTRAADFLYALSNGKEKKMSSINSDFLILFFYNPDCKTCTYTKEYLRESSVVNELIAANRLNILAFYPDEDINSWRRKAADIPSTWINAYDKQQKIIIDDKYDLRAMPTLYLLDKNKRVLLKDVTAEEIEYFLQNK